MHESNLLNLLPLARVLLPGAAIELCLADARRLELVRDAGLRGRALGVCLVLPGTGSGAAPAAAAVGTEAVIEDFGQAGGGPVTLRVRGGRRFRVERTRVRDNGMQVAQVRWCAPDATEPVRAEHGLLPVLLRAIVDQLGGDHARAGQSCFDDAAWVGWRLAELLPLHESHRQELLQMEEPAARLERLLTLVS